MPSLKAKRGAQPESGIKREKYQQGLTGETTTPK